MEELLCKYVDKFHENFPIAFFRGVNEKEIMEVIQNCININKIYIVEDDIENNY